ncbi:hypothetical protein [Rhizobium sp. Pop5]|nr:hypothetical protein [Rhizobium sp. Pop5]
MMEAEGACIADVLGKRTAGSAKGVAFEVQWSPQLAETTKARTDRYAAHDLRSLWLMKRPAPLNSREIPVARLVATDDGFDVFLPNENLVRGAEYMNMRELADLEGSWRRCGTLAEFVRGVVEGRFRFGLAPEFDVRVRVSGVSNWCYACGTETRPATSIVIDLGEVNADYPGILVEVHELGEIEGSLSERILESINRALPKAGGYRLGKRKPKESNVTYLANVCTGCGAFLSRSYIPYRSQDDVTLIEFDLKTTPEELAPFYKVIDRWCFIDPGNRPGRAMVGVHGFAVPADPYPRFRTASGSDGGPLAKIRHHDLSN